MYFDFNECYLILILAFFFAFSSFRLCDPFLCRLNNNILRDLQTFDLTSKLQILVKSILKNKSFKNPYSPFRRDSKGNSSDGSLKKAGRSYSAPESYDVLTSTR